MKKFELTGWQLVGLFAGAVFGTVFLGLVPLSLVQWNYEKAAAIGDSFGVINAVIAAVAFLGVAYAVLLQREQVRMAVEEARDSSKSAKETADLLLLAAYLAAYDSLLSAKATDAAADEKNSTGMALRQSSRDHRLLLVRLESLTDALHSRVTSSFSPPSVALAVRQHVQRLGRKVQTSILRRIESQNWDGCSGVVGDAIAELSRCIDLLDSDDDDQSVLKDDLNRKMKELGKIASGWSTPHNTVNPWTPKRLAEHFMAAEFILSFSETELR